MLEQLKQIRECEAGIDFEIKRQAELKREMEKLLEKEKVLAGELKTLAESYQKGKVEVSRLELEVQSLHQDRKKAEKQKEQAQNTKMLETAESRIQSLRQKEDELETVLLERMEAQENVETSLRDIKKKLDEAARLRQQETPPLSEDLQSSQRRLLELREEHEGLFEGTTSRFLRMHESARKALKREQVVYGVGDEGECPNCGMQVAQNDFAEMRYKEGVKACSNCLAVLFWVS